MRARTLPTFVAALGLAVGFGCSEPTGPNAPAGSRARDTGATVSAAPGAAQPVTVMTRLVPNKCMDVLAGDRSPGAQVIIWPCHGAENQLWTLPPRGTTGEVRVYGDMCLDAYGGRGNDFDPIIIWPCHGGAN